MRRAPAFLLAACSLAAAATAQWSKPERVAALTSAALERDPAPTFAAFGDELDPASPSGIKTIGDAHEVLVQ